MESTILHNVTAEQINSLFQGLQNQLNELNEKFEPKTPTEWLTRQEVADLLKVDLSTLFNWNKKGRLVPYGIGHRVLYKRSDVEQSLILLGTKKGGNNE
jgi:excisionase family DNA binding protein